jgi:hypothetical protein
MTKVDHPAKFSKGMVPFFAEVVRSHHVGVDRPISIFDPFAGTGLIHKMMEYDDRFRTFGVELEAEWANMHPRTRQGDSRCLTSMFRLRRFDVICTSPTYGNRMADHHDAQETCRPCKGTGGGWIMRPDGVPDFQTCPKCKGLGYRNHHRRTYKHRLGRDLTPGNSGAMQWGPEYWELHKKVWAECAKVHEPGGIFILNISNHIRKGVEVEVCGFHTEVLNDLGYELIEPYWFPTKGMLYGANRDKRTSGEMVLVYQRRQHGSKALQSIQKCA